eukprot:scaffold2742_cov130-Isochrysis_galbana.AAC.21
MAPHALRVSGGSRLHPARPASPPPSHLHFPARPSLLLPSRVFLAPPRHSLFSSRLSSAVMRSFPPRRCEFSFAQEGLGSTCEPKQTDLMSLRGCGRRCRKAGAAGRWDFSSCESYVVARCPLPELPGRRGA